MWPESISIRPMRFTKLFSAPKRTSNQNSIRIPKPLPLYRRLPLLSMARMWRSFSKKITYSFSKNYIYIYTPEGIKFKNKFNTKIVKNLVSRLPTSIQPILYDYIINIEKYNYNEVCLLSNKILSESLPYKNLNVFKVFLEFNYKKYSSINKILYYYS